MLKLEGLTVGAKLNATGNHWVTHTLKAIKRDDSSRRCVIKKNRKCCRRCQQENVRATGNQTKHWNKTKRLSLSTERKKTGEGVLSPPDIFCFFLFFLFVLFFFFLYATTGELYHEPVVIYYMKIYYMKKLMPQHIACTSSVLVSWNSWVYHDYEIT